MNSVTILSTLLDIFNDPGNIIYEYYEFEKDNDQVILKEQLHEEIVMPLWNYDPKYYVTNY